MTNTGGTPAGWYHAPGDPEGTQRYWDGAQWIGDPQAVPQQPQAPVASQPPQQPQTPTPPPDATVAYTPPATPQDPNAGQPPQYGAPPAGGQPPQYAAPAGAGQQPPAYGTPPPGAGTPPGYVAFGDASAAGAAGTLAEGWQRLVARLIDGLLVSVVTFIMSFLIGIVLGGIVGGFISAVVALAIGLAYEVVLTTQMGATLGKKIFNMKIVTESGGAADQALIIKRSVPWIVVAAIAIIPIIGGLISLLAGVVLVIVSIVFIFTDDQRRSVYDKAGATLVVVDA